MTNPIAVNQGTPMSHQFSSHGLNPSPGQGLRCCLKHAILNIVCVTGHTCFGFVVAPKFLHNQQSSTVMLSPYCYGWEEAESLNLYLLHPFPLTRMTERLSAVFCDNGSYSAVTCFMRSQKVRDVNMHSNALLHDTNNFIYTLFCYWLNKVVLQIC